MPDERPQFLITLRLRPPGTVASLSDDEHLLIAEHFDYAKSLLAEGRLVFAGRTQDEAPLGLIVVRAADRHEARALALADPGIEHGLFLWELRPYRVALMDGR